MVVVSIAYKGPYRRLIALPTKADHRPMQQAGERP